MYWKWRAWALSFSPSNRKNDKLPWLFMCNAKEKFNEEDIQQSHNRAEHFKNVVTSISCAFSFYWSFHYYSMEIYFFLFIFCWLVFFVTIILNLFYGILIVYVFYSRSSPTYATICAVFTFLHISRTWISIMENWNHKYSIFERKSTEKIAALNSNKRVTHRMYSNCVRQN